MRERDNAYKDMNRKLDEVLHAMTKYKGMIGAGWFIITSMITAFILVKDWIFAHVRIT